MNRIFAVSVLLLLSVAGIFGGTFTTSSTLIPVPAQATGTDAGDTSPNSSQTIHLDADVYLPDGATAPAPVIVIIHGYGGSKTDTFVVTLARDFASAGYVVVAPTMRGFGNSEGLVSLAGPNEIDDLKTIILAMQTGSIGDSPVVTIPVDATSKFGVTGGSYGGGNTFEIMRTHVAGLAAVAPIIGWTDLYQALSPNDVPKLAYGVGLFASGFDTNNPNYDDAMFNLMRDIIGGTPEQMRTGNAQQNIDWRSVIFDPAELSVPAFVIQGWRDWLFPAEQATSLFETSTAIPFFKLYLGGVGHPPAVTDITNPEALYLRGQLIRWFDYWLKGTDTGITTDPRVTVAPENTLKWSQTALVNANTFPLPGTTTTTYYLNFGHLSTLSSAGKTQSLSPTSGGTSLILTPIRRVLGGSANDLIAAFLLVNNLLNSGAGILDSNIVTQADSSANSTTYSSPPLGADVHVTGLPEVHLFVSAKSAGAYYYVQVYENVPNGNLKLITRGAFKDHATNFTAAHEVDFSPFAINHTFKTGNQISVHVSSRDFPFFLPNLSQPTVKIYRGATHPSNITLPVAP
ncbi:MAG: type transport system ATP-binding protein [Verrucomicrobiota bacterium]|jgi:ABC-2 type transport system ATP-binding protein